MLRTKTWWVNIDTNNGPTKAPKERGNVAFNSINTVTYHLRQRWFSCSNGTVIRKTINIEQPQAINEAFFTAMETAWKSKPYDTLKQLRFDLLPLKVKVNNSMLLKVYKFILDYHWRDSPKNLITKKKKRKKKEIEDCRTTLPLHYKTILHPYSTQCLHIVCTTERIITYFICILM